MKLLEQIISLYAPHCCLGCGLAGGVVCINCRQTLPASVSCCYRCKVATVNGRTCPICRQESELISVNSATGYNSPLAKQIIWSLKFDRTQAAAEIMGNLLAVKYAARISHDTLIVPVPTAPSRVRKRGYDQAVLLARSLARHTNGQYAALLKRHGSQEQIGASKQQRYDQLQGVFSVKQPERIINSRILLIDDVVTTGSTLEVAADTLKRSGARAVGALTFAQV